MSKIRLTLPDNSTLEVDAGTTALAAVTSISKGLAQAAIAVTLDGKPADLSTKLDRDAAFKVLTIDSPAGTEVFWHSSSHLMAQAIKRLFPDAQFGIGPAIDNGFYYDIDVSRNFTPEDLEKIEGEMAKIAEENLPLTCEVVSREAAMKLFADNGQQYKVEMLGEMDVPTVTLYRQGEFFDLCRGPHVPATGAIKAVKLLTIAGAYWRGNEKNKMLQRIYGVSFPDRKQLKKHLDFLEEVKKRDHRRLGKELDLFSTHDEAGSGLIYWHPKGAMIRTVLEEWWRKEHFRHGYDILYTPHIGRANLWETSGHLGFYAENMYSPMDIDGNQYYVKPMNCPFHIKIYQSNLHSYRDLPLRWAELGTVYRYEKSGVLHGLMRVRGFTQDDAHIFCTPEQIESEIREVLRFSLFVWKTLGFSEIKAYLATKPHDSVGDPARWEQAQKSLMNAVEAENLAVEIDEGGGAFYGPKIDLKVKDALGREWQMSTIQFDFNMPARFEMFYVGEDGQRHQPYMVHRALLGSLERFFGILIEHYGGKFPVWIAPVQATLVNVAEDQAGYIRQVAGSMKAEDIRVELDLRNESIGYKIRDAIGQKVPYIGVAGKKEQEEGTVSVRKRGEKESVTMSVDQFIALIRDDVALKK